MSDAITPIFVLSLPRSGSTLLQRILASNSAVSTASEPWVLLPYLYPLARDGVYAEYSHVGVYTAIQDFLAAMPKGVEDYYAAVRAAATYMYSAASSRGATYFLDKSPRYSLIAGRLIEAFPNAKFIFLWRNPVSVIASVNDTWGRGRWEAHRYKVDLYAGFERLHATYMKVRDRVLTLNYEALVTDPGTVIKQLSTYLELDYRVESISDFADVKLIGSMGDPVGIEAYKGLSVEPLTKWKRTVNSAYRRRSCIRYVRWVGPERLKDIGYDLGEILRDLQFVERNYLGALADCACAVYGNLCTYLESSIVKKKVLRARNWEKVYKHD